MFNFDNKNKRTMSMTSIISMVDFEELPGLFC